MLQFSELVSQFSFFIRVDLYETEDNFLMGEFTDCPNEGIGPLIPDSYDLTWGRRLTLPTDAQIHSNYAMQYRLFPELRENPIFLRNNMACHIIDQPNDVFGELPTPPAPFMQPLKGY